MLAETGHDPPGVRRRAWAPQFCGSHDVEAAPRAASGWPASPTVLDDAELELLATNDVFWDAVPSIEPDGEEEVYDATVLGRHNFVANGIAVHN